MDLKKLIIVMVALCFVVSVVSPVQAAEDHYPWTMHVGEEQTLIFGSEIATDIITWEYDPDYIQHISLRKTLFKDYWTVRAIKPGNTTIKVTYHRNFPYLFLSDTVKYMDLEILP